MITRPLYHKIVYTNNRINTVEWSGILYYTTKGSIAKPNKLSIICEDVFLMDKGNAAATNYTFDESVVDYMMNNPDLMKMKVGHIHSHNNMNAFFSGTDLDEVAENSQFHNYYVSLIVNNAMSPCAKIAIRGEYNSIKVKDENGKQVSMNVDHEPTVFIIGCDVRIQGLNITVPDYFSRRVDEVIKIADAKKPTYAQSFGTGYPTGKSFITPATPPVNTPKSTVNRPVVILHDDETQMPLEEEDDDNDREDYLYEQMAEILGDVFQTSDCEGDMLSVIRTINITYTKKEINDMTNILSAVYRSKYVEYIVEEGDVFIEDLFIDDTKDLVMLISELGDGSFAAKRIIKSLMTYLPNDEDQKQQI